MVKCCICGLYFKKITNSHLNKKHNLSSSAFSKKYPNVDRGLIPWNKGETKNTHPSLMRLSQRLAQQKKWNFSNWQKWNRIKLRRIREKVFKRNNNLAEFIGIILGDGNLFSFPRTEALRIVCSSKQQNYISHVVTLIQKIFNKRPTVYKRKSQNATDITFYMTNLSRGLSVPCGNKIRNKVTIPKWIKQNKIYSINCLKGLFETDGCFQVDKSNYAQYIEFKNNCKNLLQGTYQMLKNLGYHPQFGKNYIRLARKEEVFSFKDLIAFRNY